jgi:hypothetical protein
MFRLNYPGVLSDQLGVVMGPNLFSEYLQVVTQTFIPDENKTVLELVVYRGQHD